MTNANIVFLIVGLVLSFAAGYGARAYVSLRRRKTSLDRMFFKE